MKPREPLTCGLYMSVESIVFGLEDKVREINHRIGCQEDDVKDAVDRGTVETLETLAQLLRKAMTV